MRRRESKYRKFIFVAFQLFRATTKHPALRDDVGEGEYSTVRRVMRLCITSRDDILRETCLGVHTTKVMLRLENDHLVPSLGMESSSLTVPRTCKSITVRRKRTEDPKQRPSVPVQARGLWPPPRKGDYEPDKALTAWRSNSMYSESVVSLPNGKIQSRKPRQIQSAKRVLEKQS